MGSSGGLVTAGAVPASQATDAEVTAAVAAEATARATADALLIPSSWRQSVVSTENVAVTDATTITDITGLVLTIAANTVWVFEAVLFYDGSTTGDLRLVWSVPAGCGGNWTGNALATNATTNTGSLNGTAAAALTTSLSYGSVGVGTLSGGVVRGIIRNGSTAGTAQLRVRQSVLDGSNATTVFADSYLTASRLV